MSGQQQLRVPLLRVLSGIGTRLLLNQLDSLRRLVRQVGTLSGGSLAVLVVVLDRDERRIPSAFLLLVLRRHNRASALSDRVEARLLLKTSDARKHLIAVGVALRRHGHLLLDEVLADGLGQRDLLFL